MTQMNLHYLLSKLLFLYKRKTIILCCSLRCRRPTSTLTFNNSVWLMGTLVSFLFVFCVLFCYFLLCCQEYPLTWLLCISILPECPSIFLLCPTLSSFKKRVVDAVTVDNNFWICFIEKTCARIVFVSTFSYVSSFFYLEALSVQGNETCLIHLRW